MRKKFGFFLLDEKCCVKKEELIKYLARVIQKDFTCIYCNYKFKSAESCQNHILSKQHTIMNSEYFGQYERFYDFYPLYLASSGGRTLVHNGKVVFENEAAVAALTVLRRGFDSGVLPRSNFALGRDPFMDGTVAMKIIGPWFVKELDITKLGWPVAFPRFKSRPSDSTMIEWPSGKVHTSTCGLTVSRVTPGYAVSPDMSISLSKCPILPTMHWCFMRDIWSAVTTPLLPVAVITRSHVPSTSSRVATW